ncbi:MAG: YqgE/AlgH family protein [Piscirickettsiaceae bacterium]|nr:MAG: YqgE/AlgH family protein [Piscirickettsiaceae bacterium]
MNDLTYLKDNFLIAMPGMEGSDFSKSVTYLCQHDKEGALGVVINKPSTLTMGDIFKQLNVTPARPEIAKIPLFLGGPVQQERGFVLHTPVGEWDSTMVVNDQLALTSSKDILEAISQGKGPQQWLVALGYAGWGSGQLEKEIQANAWLHGKADQDIIFDEPVNQRWELAAHRIGVDISLMSMDAGHC